MRRELERRGAQLPVAHRVVKIAASIVIEVEDHAMLAWTIRVLHEVCEVHMHSVDVVPGLDGAPASHWLHSVLVRVRSVTALDHARICVDIEDSVHDYVCGSSYVFDHH